MYSHSPSPQSLPDHSYNTLVNPNTLSGNLELCCLLLHHTELSTINEYYLLCSVLWGSGSLSLLLWRCWVCLHSFLTLAHFQLRTPFTNNMFNIMQYIYIYIYISALACHIVPHAHYIHYKSLSHFSQF